MARVIGFILHLHGGAAYALVFALPALESSAFLGFLFPGELAVILGGVLASQGRISLGAAIAAAVLGAVVGDSVGYLIGRRWGRRLLHGTLGRLPVIRDRLDRHLDTAQAAFKYRYKVVIPAEPPSRPAKPKVAPLLAGAAAPVA